MFHNIYKILCHKSYVKLTNYQLYATPRIKKFSDEEAVNTSEIHSDEWSSDDEALAQDERNNKKRAERVLNTNSVIKVFDKK